MASKERCGKSFVSRPYPSTLSVVDIYSAPKDPDVLYACVTGGERCPAHFVWPQSKRPTLPTPLTGWLEAAWFNCNGPFLSQPGKCPGVVTLLPFSTTSLGGFAWGVGRAQSYPVPRKSSNNCFCAQHQLASLLMIQYKFQTQNKPSIRQFFLPRTAKTSTDPFRLQWVYLERVVFL